MHDFFLILASFCIDPRKKNKAKIHLHVYNAPTKKGAANRSVGSHARSRPKACEYKSEPCRFYLNTRTRTSTNPNGTEANAAGRSGNARALHKQSKCEMIQEGEALAKFLGKFAKIEVFVGFAHSAEQQRGRRASRGARDLRNTRSTRKRSKCAFQRARRLLFCP